MKINNIMQVQILNHTLTIGHLDLFGDLGMLFQAGNAVRFGEGKPAITLAKYIALNSTSEFIAAVSEDIGCPAVRATKGKGGGTSAHLYILLDAAAHLSPKLKLEMYKIFVEGKLLQWRDRSGDEYIELNLQLSFSAEIALGKPSHKGHYIQLAKIIKSRILPENHSGWNYADPSQLHERARIEQALSFCLKNGFVKDWDHLKELAGKV